MKLVPCRKLRNRPLSLQRLKRDLRLELGREPSAPAIRVSLFATPGRGPLTEALSRYEFDALPSTRSVTISFDVTPSDVELALATNAASLRHATLIALLAAMVVDDAL
jgi:hypothetical protein